MDYKRIEITAGNVHTSRGKWLRGYRGVLPAAEAEHLVGQGRARGVGGPVPQDEVAEAMAVEIPEDLGPGREEDAEPEQGEAFDVSEEVF